MSRLLVLLASTYALTARAQSWSAPFFLDTPVQGPGGGEQLRPDVTWSGSHFLVVWDDARSGQGSDVWGAAVDVNGATVLANRPLVIASGNQRSASVAMGSSNALVAWLDEGACSEVMAAVVTPALELATAPARLSMGACTTNRPAVAWNATSSTWLVAWGDHGAGRELRLRFVSAAGVAGTELTLSAPNSASNPRLAAVGPDFVVAWQDDRVTAGTPDVLVALVSASNGLGAPVQVEPSASAQTNPVVASSPTEVALVWRESGALRLLRFDTSLVATGASQPVAAGDQPALAWLGSGSDFFVAFEAPDNSGTGLFGWSTTAPLPVAVMPRQGSFDRRATRVAAGGGALVMLAAGPVGHVSGADILLQQLGPGDAGVRRVSEGVASARDVRGAFDGSRYLTVWRDEGRSAAGSDSMGQLVTPATGEREGPDAGLRFSVGSANLASFPEVAGGDGGFFVTWGDDGSGGALVGVNVAASGAARASRVLSDLSSYVNTHASVFTGQGYLTLSLKNGALRSRLTSATSVVLQPETVVFNSGAAPERVQAARVGDVSLAVFLARDGGVDVQGARFGPDASVLDAAPVVLSALPGDEADCTVAASPTEFLVGFTSATDAGREVFVSRVSSAGVVRDVPAVRVGTGTQPALGWTGASWLVSWREADDLVAARFDAELQRLDAAPVPVANSSQVERSPDITPGPSGEVLLTWDAYSPMDQNFRAFGRLFTEAPADAATFDADAGDSLDAGVEPLDGGAEGDAGVFVPTQRQLVVGCSVAPGPWLLLLLLVSASRSRRTPSSGSAACTQPHRR